MDPSLKQTVTKYALQNAVKYKGKANIGAVIGKVLAENPELKKDTKKLSQEIKKIVDEVNSLSVEKQREEIEKFSGELKEAVQEKKDIFSVFDIKEGEGPKPTRAAIFYPDFIAARHLKTLFKQARETRLVVND